MVSLARKRPWLMLSIEQCRPEFVLKTAGLVQQIRHSRANYPLDRAIRLLLGGYPKFDTQRKSN